MSGITQTTHQSPNSQTPTEAGSPKTKLAFVLAIIFGIAGFGVAGAGVCGFLHVGALANLGQLNSILMMSIGGGGGLVFLIVGSVGLKKTSGAQNHAPNNTPDVLPSPKTPDSEKGSKTEDHHPQKSQPEPVTTAPVSTSQLPNSIPVQAEPSSQKSNQPLGSLEKVLAEHPSKKISIVRHHNTADKLPEKLMEKLKTSKREAFTTLKSTSDLVIYLHGGVEQRNEWNVAVTKVSEHINKNYNVLYIFIGSGKTAEDPNNTYDKISQLKPEPGHWFQAIKVDNFEQL